MSSAGSGSADDSRLITGRWAELIVALILSATVVATAFSAFQAGKWGGAMTVAFNEAAVNRTIAATDIAQASRDITGDRATFSSYVLALAGGQEAVAEILFEEFRDEVKPLITVWLAADPLNNPAVPSPFDDPSYSVIGTVEDAEVALDEAETFTTIALEARVNMASTMITNPTTRTNRARIKSRMTIPTPTTPRLNNCRNATSLTLVLRFHVVMV